jgi:hypothetical protein
MIIHTMQLGLTTGSLPKYFCLWTWDNLFWMCITRINQNNRNCQNINFCMWTPFNWSIFIKLFRIVGEYCNFPAVPIVYIAIFLLHHCYGIIAFKGQLVWHTSCHVTMTSYSGLSGSHCDCSNNLHMGPPEVSSTESGWLNDLVT